MSKLHAQVASPTSLASATAPSFAGRTLRKVDEN